MIAHGVGRHSFARSIVNDVNDARVEGDNGVQFVADQSNRVVHVQR
jgi:hypothetical protein